MQGMPIRLELGPKDMGNQTVMLAMGVKETVAWTEVPTRVPELWEKFR